MRILICGGREFANQEKFDRVMRPFGFIHKSHEGEDIFVIHGACGWPFMKGADAMADRWALDLGIEPERYPADWKRYGNSAGPIRNAEMLRESKPDWVIAFPGGSGTRNMVELTLGAIRGGAKIVLIEVR